MEMWSYNISTSLLLCLDNCSSTICNTNMYIIKVKGKAKIPDYIQLRNDDFVLVAYFRADRPLKQLSKYGLDGKEIELSNLISILPFGKLQKLEL